MNKRLIRKVTAVLATLALFVSVTACTAAENEPSKSGSPDSSSTQSVSSQSEGSQEQNQEPVHITIWHHESPAHRIAAWDALCEKFTENNPGYSASAEFVLWADAMPKLLSAAAAGTMPEIHQAADAQWSTALVAGTLLPVNDIVEEIDEKQHFAPSSLTSFTVDGKIYGVPVSSATLHMVYRPSMLEEAGFDEFPETWPEFEEFLKAATKDTDGDGVVDQWGLGLDLGRDTLGGDQLLTFLAQKGLDAYNENGDPIINDPKALEVISWFTDIVSKYCPPNVTSWMPADQDMALTSGTCASILTLSPQFPVFFEMGSRDVAAAPVPHPDDQTREDTPTLLTNHALNVTLAAESPEKYEAVRKFLNFALEPENVWLLSVAQEPGFFSPPTKTGVELVESGYYNEEYFPITNFDFSEGSADRELFDSHFKVCAGYYWEGWGPHNKYGPVNLAANEINGAFVLNDMLAKILVDKQTVQEAADWAQDKMTKMTEETRAQLNK